MGHMELYSNFNHMSIAMKHQDQICPQAMLVHGEYYIWQQLDCVLLLRFARHHSDYAIVANVLIYRGLQQSEDDLPQVLATSGGTFYKLGDADKLGGHKACFTSDWTKNTNGACVFARVLTQLKTASKRLIERIVPSIRSFHTSALTCQKCIAFWAHACIA